MKKKIAEWSDELATGIDWQDEQHQKWVEQMTVLHKAATTMETSVLTFQKAIKFLDDYIIFHFSAEEVEMEKSNYPQLLAHKEDHEKFKVQFEKFKEESLGEGLVDCVALCYDMNEWIFNHIANDDKKMANFLKENQNNG